MEMEFKNSLREALETCTKELEKKVLDVNPKLEDVSCFGIRTFREI